MTETFEPRTSMYHALDRLKKKSPESVNADDLLSFLLPTQRFLNQAQINRFKKFLSVNPKISYDHPTDSYRYKPTLLIYSGGDLLTYLQKQETALGALVRDLKDGWPNAQETVDKLESEHRLLVTRQKKDNHPHRVWADDPSLHVPLDQDFKTLWEKTPLPLEEDIIQTLERERINPTGQVAVLNTGAAPKKKVKKVRRSEKTTNFHMQGQLRDYSSQRPQAGK